MKKNQRVPSHFEVSDAIEALDIAMAFAVGPTVSLKCDNAQVLLDYIKSLEADLSNLNEQYHGVPTEYFNVVRQEHLTYKGLGVPSIYDNVPHSRWLGTNPTGSPIHSKKALFSNSDSEE